jgi:CheY-like chemotaxis protein
MGNNMEVKRKRVLVVDDELSNLKILTHILKSEYDVQTVKDGRDALRTANALPPDLILLDIIMADMDGYQVLAELKAADKTRNVPVILISGISKGEDEEKWRSSGAADYIRKPFSAATVKAKIQEHVGDNGL